MSGWADWLAQLAWAWALLAGMLPMVALARRQWMIWRTPQHPANPRRVLLLRPCAGEEASLHENLVALPVAPGITVDVAMGVSDTTDPAWPEVQRAARTLRMNGHSARARVCAAAGANRKASILAGLVAAEQHDAHDYDFIVNADSNVDLGGFPLGALLTPMEHDAQVGAAWCAVAESGAGELQVEPHDAARERSSLRAFGAGQGVGVRATEAVLCGSLHAFPLLGGLDPEGLVGKLFAVRPRALARAGGFGAVAGFLGEDFRLAHNLRAAAFRIAPVFVPARAQVTPVDYAAAVARFSRWMQVVRAQRPALLPTYPAFFFPVLPVSVTAGLARLGGAEDAFGAVGCVVLVRVFTALVARRCAKRPWHVGTLLVDSLLADATLTAAFFRALLTREVTWRGRRLTLQRSGRLCES